MILFPNAKVNLGLRVLGKRTDGYHNIETVMMPIAWSDALEVVAIAPGAERSAWSLKRRRDEGELWRRGERAKERLGDTAKWRGGEGAAWPEIGGHWTTFDEAGFSYTRSGIPVPGDPADDLVVKAYRLFKSYAEAKGIPMSPIQAHLHKRIPSGSGLGGGSSNGASMLKLLAGMFGAHWPQPDISEDLHILASKLGSDCPFFLHDSPMHATGRGDILKPVSVNALKGMHLMVVVPPVQISTKETYAAVTLKPCTDSLSGIIQQPLQAWKDALKNEFEPWVFHHYPTIKKIKETLYDEGAEYASMSGSGSAVFGLFHKKPEKSLKKRFQDCSIWEGII